MANLIISIDGLDDVWYTTEVEFDVWFIESKVCRV